ncbi:MAG: glutamate-1-semialdehyde 2,1-aminomutase [Deltaproteobacteria bacterium]|nr:glutamate-1-semialdehyde 2,1-aminomutase [Deltaproteobacteria bacterium]
MDRPRSHALFEKARALMPGGVNSPVRAFRGVGGEPVFFKSGAGAWLTDVDGHRYVDYVGSWGPLIFGHAPRPVTEAIAEAAQGGTSFGAPHEREIELAELIRAAVPSVQKVRLVSSGSEATTAAIRLARGFTGRDLIVKFEGCYHGAVDSLLVKAGSGVETLGLPDSPGVPADLARLTLTLPFNDLERARELFAHRGAQIAALIIEPVVGNMGVLVPRDGYLQGLADLCQRHGALFICDEVMTGFRVHFGGAQALYGLKPDLTTFGKIIGGGLPVGAYGGRADVMARIAPEGPVYQAGTLSGNPLATAAGIAMLKELARPGVYERLEGTAARLAQGLRERAAAHHLKASVNRVGSMLTLFFAPEPPFDYASAKKADAARFGRFFHGMLDRGVYLPPSQFEAAFVSLAHGEAEIAHTLAAADEALSE